MLDARRAVRNFGSVAAMRVGTAAASFLFFVFLARHWSADGLGRFTTVLAFYFLLYQVPLLGLHVPIIRELAQRPERLREVAGNLTVVGLVVGLLLALALGVVGMLAYPPAMHGALWLVAASLVPSAVAGVAETALIARERLGTIAAVNAAEVAVRTALWCAVVVAGAGLTALGAVLLAGRLLAVALYLRGELAGLLREARYDVPGVRALLRLAPVYLGLLVLAAAVSRVDFVALSQLATFEEVGLYSAPYKLYEAAMMVPTILIVVVFPAAARLAAHSAAAFDAAARQLCRLWVTAGLPIAVVVGLLAEPVLRGLFGETYVAAVPALRWLVAVPVVASVDATLSCVLQARHRQVHDLRALATALAVYVVGLLAAIPAFGFTGAAAATAGAALVQAVLRHRAACRQADFGGLGSVLVSPVVAGAAMVGAAVALRGVPTVVGAAASVAVYVAVLAATRGVTSADVRHLRGALQAREQAA